MYKLADCSNKVHGVWTCVMVVWYVEKMLHTFCCAVVSDYSKRFFARDFCMTCVALTYLNMKNTKHGERHVCATNHHEKESHTFVVRAYRVHTVCSECCMSGQESKVKGPIAAPDGTFPLLEKDGVREHCAFKQETNWHWMYFEFGLGNTSGQSVWPVLDIVCIQDGICIWDSKSYHHSQI